MSPQHSWGTRKAALVLLSSDVIPKPGYLSQGPQVLRPPGNGPFLSSASPGCEGSGEGPSSHMPLAAEGVWSWDLPSSLRLGCPMGARCPA